MSKNTRVTNKIVIFERTGTNSRNIRFTNKIALQTGDNEKCRGIENSKPIMFFQVDGIEDYFTTGSFEFAGYVFQEQLPLHSDVRVFCNTYVKYDGGPEPITEREQSWAAMNLILQVQGVSCEKNRKP